MPNSPSPRPLARHVDPWYVVGSKAECYCETFSSCPRSGAACGMATNATTAAAPWGTSEGNCATPKPLFESAAAFMAAEAGDAPLVYFTGDFSEAGASYACHADGGEAEARRQVLDVMAYDRKVLETHLPGVRMLGSLGNHDAAPGDVFLGPKEQAWQYVHTGDVLWQSQWQGLATCPRECVCVLYEA